MSPIDDLNILAKRYPDLELEKPPSRSGLSVDGGYLEAWAQGYHVGSLVILMLIVFCNYRSKIWLHKLVLLEVCGL
jgi:hypothetical protein